MARRPPLSRTPIPWSSIHTLEKIRNAKSAVAARCRIPTFDDLMFHTQNEECVGRQSIEVGAYGDLCRLNGLQKIDVENIEWGKRRAAEQRRRAEHRKPPAVPRGRGFNLDRVRVHFTQVEP